MIVLALDTCDARGSVSLLRNDVVLHTVVHDGTDEYSSWLLPAVDRSLAASAVLLANVELYAVATGPGSFTGVRIGLTTTKAWSEAFGKPIAAVTRLDALADEHNGDAPYVATAVNALRGQVYAAMYKRVGNSTAMVGAEMVMAPGDFVSWVVEQAGSQRVDWISTDAEMITGAQEWLDRSARSVGVAQKEGILTVPCVLAPMVGRRGRRKALAGEVVDALALDATYIRRPDAEVLWNSGAAPQKPRATP